MTLHGKLIPGVVLMAIASLGVRPASAATVITSNDPLILQPSATSVLAEVLYTSGDDNVRIQLPNGDYRMLTLTKAEQHRLGVRPGAELLLVTEGDRVLYIADAETPVEVATVETIEVEQYSETVEVEQETVIEPVRPEVMPSYQPPVQYQPSVQPIPARPSPPEPIRGLW